MMLQRWELCTRANAAALAVLLCAAVAPAAAPAPQDSPGNAPADAFEEGNPLPFYGSEGLWSRRMFSEKNAAEQYKRRGQRLLLHVLDGKPEQAVREAEQWIAKDGKDSEAWFVLAAAKCALGKPDEAYAAILRAVEAGAPFGRFLAGPRELFEPLYALEAFQTYAEAHPTPLLHGPMIGCVTHESARVWLRTAREALTEVRVYAGDASGSPAAQAAAQTVPANDYVAMLDVGRLAPATTYRYDVLIDGKIAMEGERPSLTTAPAPGAPCHFKIAFGGGAGFNPPHERIWDTIGTFNPAGLLMLGDNVYVDLPEMPGPFHRYTYYCRQSRPEFRRLIARTPVYAIWDDHDSSIDDAWLGPYRDKPAWKQPQIAFFKNNWVNPGYGSEAWPACWFRFAIGDVEFFLLDGRTYRTNPRGERPSMLGLEQMAWLLDGLAKSKATFKVIASPVPWTFVAKGDSLDTWNGFRTERDAIFAFLAQQRISGVVLLSADRHRSDAWRIEREGAYPLFEFSSSRLTNTHTHEEMPGALFSYNDTCSFGLVTFDTTVDDPSVTYDVVTIDGSTVHSLTLHHSELTQE